MNTATVLAAWALGPLELVCILAAGALLIGVPVALVLIISASNKNRRNHQ